MVVLLYLMTFSPLMKRSKMRIEQPYGERYSVESFSENPKIKIFFACEGKETEYHYLNGVMSIRSKLKIDPLIEVIPIKHEKNTSSNPLLLLKDALTCLESTTFSEDDKFVLVVDRDKNSFTEEQYDEVLAEIRKNDAYTLVVSNPCFELWLLLHHETLDNYSLPFVLENKKVDVDKITRTKGRTYIENCLKLKQGGTYSKTHLRFNRFYKDKVQQAIINSKKYCLTEDGLKNNVGTNFGVLLEGMIK